ncbi:MAG: PAS domain S-box protein [Leptolyngbya sp. IPPAS B-1204]
MRSDLPDLEVALGQADLLFRTLFEQSGVGIAFLDSDRRVIKANQKFCDLLSYHTTDLPLPLPDLIHPEDWQLLCIGLHTLDSGIQSNFSLEKRYICKNGVFLWANTTVARVGEVSSAPQLYTLMVQDISTCKQTEAAYQQRESQLSSILNCTNAAIARLRRLSDQEFEYDYMSAGCQQVFGFSAEEFLADKHLWRSHVFPDDLAKLLLPEQVTQPRVLTAEYRFYHKDGNLRWIAGFVTAEWDAASNSWVLTAIDVDITERKRTEAELREKEAFLRSIYEGVRTSIFVVDITADGDFHYAGFNPVHVKMTGITNEALRGKTPEQVLPPTTAAEVRRNYQRCVEEGGILFEERLSFQGQDLWWQTRLTPLQDEQGRIYRIVGTSNNITKRKQAQMALQASQERLNFLLTSSPAVIYTAKPESPYTATFVSQNIETLTGYKVEQFYQESGFWLQCLHPDDVSVVHQAITQLIKNGHVSYEYRFCIHLAIIAGSKMRLN